MINLCFISIEPRFCFFFVADVFVLGRQDAGLLGREQQQRRQLFFPHLRFVWGKRKRLCPFHPLLSLSLCVPSLIFSLSANFFSAFVSSFICHSFSPSHIYFHLRLFYPFLLQTLILALFLILGLFKLLSFSFLYAFYSSIFCSF